MGSRLIEQILAQDQTNLTHDRAAIRTALQALGVPPDRRFVWWRAGFIGGIPPGGYDPGFHGHPYHPHNPKRWSGTNPNLAVVTDPWTRLEGWPDTEAEISRAMLVSTMAYPTPRESGALQVSTLLGQVEWQTVWLAGLWRVKIGHYAVMCLLRPNGRFDANGRPHAEDGPALWWRRGSAHWFWHGVEVPSWVVTTPDKITLKTVTNERNAEVRRVMLERVGIERLAERDGKLVATDAAGTLYRLEGASGLGDAILMMQVRNSTPEPDGSYKHYWLRVPPTIGTPQEAVAWTFQMNGAEYQPAVET